jgi:hypothetical protein
MKRALDKKKVTPIHAEGDLKTIQDDKKDGAKSPPEQPIKSLQFDLFGAFVTNNRSEVSNTIAIWERIPKYFPTRTLDKLRPENGHPDPYEWEYVDNNIKYMVVVQPALIKVNGSYKAYFPGTTEELIEEAIKKILSDQQYGIHDPTNSETWVRFSLCMLYRELKDRGCTRSRPQIKHAIEVMNKCNISFLKEGKEIWSGAILQDLVTVGRDDYIANTDAQHIARLPVFISNAINCFDYRQFNYTRLMRCNSPLSRWIYKRLIHRFKQANLFNDYHFMYEDLKGSGLLQQARESDNRTKVLGALDELVSRGVLVRHSSLERKEGQKVINVKYTVYPSSDFIKEQKAAGKRDTDNDTKARDSGLKIVDKSGQSRRFNPQ